MQDPSDIYDPSQEEDDEVDTHVRYEISSYGVDFPVDSLVNRLKRDDIVIPEFQRGFVWSKSQASRFIESLLLGLPVPGIFLAKEPDSSKLLVIDGQQRLFSLKTFYKGIFAGKEFKLTGVTERLASLTYESLDESDRRTLDDAVIHATVIKQDNPENDDSSIYLIFERLNTSGTALSPQEIRTCVYHGPFIELLKELNEDENWREIYGPLNKRAKDQELILRILALFYERDSYERPMKTFLNNFMIAHKKLDTDTSKQFVTLFKKMSALAAEHIGKKGFRPERSLNASVTDAFFVGIGSAIEANADLSDLESKSKKLLENEEFLAHCKVGTTHLEAVKQRMAMAVETFCG